jgi:hypothetical protein
MVGYFTVNEYVKEGFVDWTWLMARDPIESKAFTRLLRFENPLIIKINGLTNEGVIFKPGESE